MSEEEMREEREKAPEVLEEAPADFVVDVNGLELMVQISDLLYEAARSGDPTRYIEEIERLSSSAGVTKEKKRRARRPAATAVPKRAASKRKARTPKKKKGAKSK